MTMLKSSAVVAAFIIFIAIIFIGGFRQLTGGYLGDVATYFPNSYSKNSSKIALDSSERWTHIIWQSSKYPTENQTGDEIALSRSWAEMNPSYRHEMVTHERMLGYIKDKFHSSRPKLEHLYDETADYMMRTDVLRYLLLLHDGGVYNDLDVECLKPINTWLDQIPEDLKKKAGVVVGIENDFTKDDQTHVLGLVVWTMMAKPNQPFVRFVLDRLQKNMQNLSAEEQSHLNTHELMDVTGPAATTVSFMAYASEVTGTNVSYLNFTGMKEPVLMGEVLVLPIWSFGAEHQVTKAGFRKDEGEVLVKHHFAGTWKADHGDNG